MYLLLNKDTGEIKFSNESAKLEEETAFLPCEGMEWTSEAREKMPLDARDDFENKLRFLYSNDCGYGDCEAFGATFEELAPALEYVSIEEINALKERYGIEEALLRLEWIDEDACDTSWEYL